MSGRRPATVVLVAGSGTDVGKTWVSARLLEWWRSAGLVVAARKPAQSFSPGQGPTDAEVLAAAAGEAPETVCPPGRSYPVALAPPMAAAALGMPPPLVAELAALSWPEDPSDIGVVETAGGVRSPQADDGDVVDLVHQVRPDAVLLVADSGLGCINAVRLSVDALGLGAGRPALVVALNRFDRSDDVHERSRTWLAERCGLEVHATDAAGLAPLAQRLRIWRNR